MGWFFSKKVEKEEFNQFKEAVQTALNRAKGDVGNISTWIKHLDSSDSKLKEEISEINEEITSMKDELENIKNMISLIGNRGLFKQRQTVFNKQLAVHGVLNSVQTPVQTPFLDNLTATERAIIFILLNTDMKLSYEDISAMLGKSKATVRGQINGIRQKSEGLIEEQISENNKKRVFIPERIRNILLKNAKVRTRLKKDQE